MFFTPSHSRLKKLLKRYSNLEYLSALFDVDSKTVCLWCAVYGFRNKQLRNCPIKADDVVVLRRKKRSGVKFDVLAAEYGLNNKQLAYILDEYR